MRSIFCGKKPESKNLEHVLPLWLIEQTGNPNRNVTFGHNLIDDKLRIIEVERNYGNNKKRKGYFIRHHGFENLVLTKDIDEGKGCYGVFIYIK